jgi:hypothetical protein
MGREAKIANWLIWPELCLVLWNFGGGSLGRKTLLLSGFALTELLAGLARIGYFPTGYSCSRITGDKPLAGRLL